MKNKKGVIRIIEAFIAIVILLGVVILLMQKQPAKTDFSSSVYQVQSQVLDEIAQSNQYRNAVFSGDNLKIDCYIQSRLAKFTLDFNSSICDINAPCSCKSPSNTNVYSADTLLSGNLTQYQPKRLLLCSWIGTATQRNCAAGPSCTYPFTTSCYQNNVWGFDSCSSPREIITSCNAGTTCGADVNYCSGNTVRAKQTCIDNGCSANACTSTSREQNDHLVTTCSGATPNCANGACQAAACVPISCSGRECGSDGCSGSCGNCATSGTCVGTSGQVYAGTCSAAGICNKQAAPAEICGDGTDNNCNGNVDEGCIILTCDGQGYLSKYNFIFNDVNCKPSSVSGTDCGTKFFDSLTQTLITLNQQFYNAHCGEDAACNFGNGGCTSILLTGWGVNTPSINTERLICLRKGTFDCRVTIRRIA